VGGFAAELGVGHGGGVIVTGFEVEMITPPGATATVRAVEESTLGGGGSGLERSGDASQPHLVRGRGTVVA